MMVEPAVKIGPEASPAAGSGRSSLRDVLAVSLKLGLTSFGGPIAHLGYFREEYVVRRRWLDEETYADLVALCQFLPGPASSQVGIGIGTMRAGPLGGLAAWTGFTLPSAIALTALAYGVDRFDLTDAGWVDGLKIVAVAVVAQAVWGMFRKFCTDRVRVAIAMAAAIAVLVSQTALTQVIVIIVAAIVSWRFFRTAQIPTASSSLTLPINRRLGVACLSAFAGLLVALPLLNSGASGGAIDLIARFYRVGALVFGGGHVVLPLLQTEVVSSGWMSDDQFVAGYGATQAVPGPLFAFSSYLGAIRGPEPNGIFGSAVALIAIFLPAYLLILGTLPFWHTLRSQPVCRTALIGINAAVVGLLLAALYDPVWTSAIHHPVDVGLAAICLALLMKWSVPPWLVVLFAAVSGQALASFT